MKIKVLVTLASVVVGVLIVAGAYAVSANRDSQQPPPPPPPAAAVEPGPVTPAELAAADGQDGRPCLVAVEGVVYQIEGFPLWRDGEHLPSDGRATCGVDLSEVIRSAPHGTDKLDLLVEIGPLEQ